jgi:hypothetical protein
MQNSENQKMDNLREENTCRDTLALSHGLVGGGRNMYSSHHTHPIYIYTPNIYTHVPAMACKPPEKSPPEMAALAATTNVYGSMAICSLVVVVAVAELGFRLDLPGSSRVVGWVRGPRA